MAEEKKESVEQLKKEIERLKKEMEELKKEVEKEEKEGHLDKEKVVEVLDTTENLIKKAFSLAEGAIIGAIEGAKKNIK